MKMFVICLMLTCAVFAGSKEEKLWKVLKSENATLSQKAAVAEKMKNDPGSYDPFTLLLCGLHYIKVKDLDNAATVCSWAFGRCCVDCLCTSDASLQDLPSVIQMEISFTMDEHLTPEEQDELLKLFIAKKTDFEAWDRATPRNYEREGIDYSEEEQQERIERYYRELGGKLNEEDYAKASRDDEYYYDRATRTFFHNESGLSFQMPDGFEVTYDPRECCFTAYFTTPSSCRIYMNANEKSEPVDIEKCYNNNVEFSEDDEDEDMKVVYSFEKATVGENRAAYCERVHYTFYPSKQELIDNRFHFAYGPYKFEINVGSQPAEEKEDLARVQPLLDSIRFGT